MNSTVPHLLTRLSGWVSVGSSFEAGGGGVNGWGRLPYRFRAQRSGGKYIFVTSGMARPAALTLVKKLAGAPLANRTPKVRLPMRGGLPGFICTGLSDSFGRAYSGLCITSSRKIYFGWGITTL